MLRFRNFVDESAVVFMWTGFSTMEVATKFILLLDFLVLLVDFFVVAELQVFANY